MAENTPERLYIRPYEPEDEKQVRFMVGQAQMEHLAFANNRGTYVDYVLVCNPADLMFQLPYTPLH